MRFLFLFTICLSFVNAQSSDLEFLKRPPISSRCQVMLDKKEKLDDDIRHSIYLFQRASRLEDSLSFDRKASQARAKGIKARIQIKKIKLQEEREKHLEKLIREGCPTFKP